MKLVAESKLQQRKASDGQFSGMPRSIRTRLLNPRKKLHQAGDGKAGPAMAVAAMPADREVAQSAASGKTALGPWLGPYMPSGLMGAVVGAMPAGEEAPPSPLYVHYKGRVFSDLEGHAAEGAEGAVLEEGRPAGAGPLAAGALPTLHKDHIKELAQMQGKGFGKRHNDALHGSPRGAARRRSMRALNQPRASY